MSVLPVAKLVTAGLAAAMALTGGHAAPASGKRFELSVRIIDRSGQLVSPLDLQFMNVAIGNNSNVDLGQGTSRSVRPGRYNVVAWIGTGSGDSQTFTLADRIVDVTRNRTITLDARKGKPVRVSINAPGAVEELLELAPLIHGNWAFNPGPVAATESVHSVYVVPMTARGMTLYTYSVWEKQGNTIANPSPFRYDIINVHRGGLPANPAYAVRRSSLAKVSITVRATDQDQQATLELQPMPPSLPLNAGTTLGATPAHLVSYRSPGYQWQPLVDLQSPAGELQDFVLNMTPYRRGHFTEKYFAAVISPQDINAGAQGRTLQASIGQFPLGDPLHANSGNLGSGITTAFRLYSGSRLLASSHGKNLNVRIPAPSHWYNLRLDVTRNPGATLSTQIHAQWHFRAHSSFAGFQCKLYEMRLLAQGLDPANQAASGAITPVTLRLYPSETFTPVRVAVLRAQESTDDGQTWRAVTIRLRGDRYILRVHDPAQAGFVSLRLFAKDSSGTWEKLTVIHAYGVR